MVVRTPASPVDDVVPADRPITVFDVLASQAGYGFPSDFTLPAVQEFFTVQKDGRVPSNFPPADTGFEVPAAKRVRFTSFYRPGDDGSLELADDPDGEWSSLPALPLGNGGPASTADDWLAFCGCCRPAGWRPTAAGCCQPTPCA
ncbi:hypothetical protein [Streptomyces sp. 900105755]